MCQPDANIYRSDVISVDVLEGEEVLEAHGRDEDKCVWLLSVLL